MKTQSSVDPRLLSRRLSAACVFACLLAAPALLYAETRTYTYAYDQAGRLVEVADETHRATIAYDAMGNVLSRTVPEPAAGFANLAALAAVLGIARRRRRGAGRRLGRRRSSLVVAGLLALALFAPGAARAHTVFLVGGGDNFIPLSLLGDLSLQAEREATGGVYTSIDFAAIDVACTATITIVQTAGPTGFVVVNPTPPPGPVMRFDFSLDVIQLPTVPITVTFTLTWIGTGGPGPSCGTNTETNLITITVDPPSESSANLGESGTTVDPINSYSGELYTTLPPLLNLGGPMPLYFDLYYASYLGLDGSATPSVGDNWLHNFDWKLVNLGNVVRVVTDEGRVVSFAWDGASGYVLMDVPDIPFQLATDILNRVLLDPRTNRSYRFDLNGKLVGVEDRVGNTHSLSYNGNQLAQVTDGLGRTLTFAYNGSLLASVTDGSRIVSFAHTGGNLTSITDARGNVRSFSYATPHAVPGLMASSTMPAGNGPLFQTFDTTGETLSQADAAADTYDLVYASPLTTITDPLGNADLHSHDARARLVAWTDAAGRTTSMTYNANDQRITLTDRLGATVSFDYHPESGQLSSFVAANGETRSFTFAGHTRSGLDLYTVSSAAYPDGSGELFVRNPVNGNLTTFNDTAGNQWSYAYNAAGQLTLLSFPDGGTTSYSYNADGTLATQTDNSGNVVSLSYDTARRLSGVSHADGTSHAFGYDANDNIVSYTDGAGGVTSAVYDANDQLTSVTNTLGHVISYGFDAQNRLASRTNPVGGVSSYSYDEEDRLLTGTDSRGNVTTYGYDNRGRLTELTDPAGQVYSYAWDDEGTLTSATGPLGNTTSYLSDELARLTRITTPLGHQRQMVYDSMDQITSLTDPLGQQTTYSYDALGSLASLTRADGSSVSYTRNTRRQITQLTDPNGNPWNQAFDLQGRSIGRSDPLGNSWSYSFDNRNRVSHVVLPAGSFDLTYDANGMPVRRLYSDGTDLNFSYDAVKKLTGGDGLALVHDANDAIVSSNGIAITRGPGGRITQMTLAPGKTVTFAYDARNLLTGVTDWQAGVTALAYDAERRLGSITRPNGVITTYSYDADSRVVGITEGVLAATTLSRDANGQIVGATRNVPTAPAVAVMANGTTAYDAASQVVGQSYDTMGRLTDDGVRTYTWNLANQLSSHSDGVVATGAEYNALGHRIGRTRGAQAKEYVWNYATSLPVVNVVREAAVDTRYYVTTPQGFLLYSIEASNGERRDYHFDEMGNTLFLSDAGGAVLASYAYDPYGKRLGGTGVVDNPYTWQGQVGVMDEGGDLYYMLTRYYDAAAGRFLSRDPIPLPEPETVNPYQFAQANPLLYIDPAGLTPVAGPAPLNSGGPPPGEGDCCATPPQFGFLLNSPGGLGRLWAAFKAQPYLLLARTLDAHAAAIMNGTPMHLMDDMIARISGTVGMDAGDDALTVARRYYTFFRQGFNRHTGEVINVANQLDDLERVATTASKFRTFGNVLAGFGIALDAGLTVYDGVCHDDGAGRIVWDTSATVAADALVLTNPAVAVGDLVTGGGISGGLQNVATTLEVTCELVFGGNWTPADAARTKRRMSRKLLTRGAWNAGEWWENQLGLSDYMVWIFD